MYQHYATKIYRTFAINQLTYSENKGENISRRALELVLGSITLFPRLLVAGRGSNVIGRVLDQSQELSQIKRVVRELGVCTQLWMVALEQAHVTVTEWIRKYRIYVSQKW